MQAIRSINIRAKAGTIVTVPEDEVWKVYAKTCGSVYDFNDDFGGGPDRILGGGTSISLGDGSKDGLITGIAFKL